MSFPVLFAYLCIFFEDVSIQILSNWVVFLFLASKCSLFILFTSPLSDILFAKIWSHSLHCFLILIKSNSFIIFLLLLLVFLVLYQRNHCLIQGHEDLCLCFLTRVYSFCSHILVFNSFRVNFCNLSYRGPDLFFCMCTESCPYNTCWKDSFFSLIFLVLWLKIQFTVKVFMFCTSICLFWMTVLQSLDYCNFEVSFKIGKYDIPMFFSFFRNILGILSRFHFYMNFRIGSTCQFLQIILLRF